MILWFATLLGLMYGLYVTRGHKQTFIFDHKGWLGLTLMFIIGSAVLAAL